MTGAAFKTWEFWFMLAVNALNATMALNIVHQGTKAYAVVALLLSVLASMGFASGKPLAGPDGAQARIMTKRRRSGDLANPPDPPPGTTG